MAKKKQGNLPAEVETSITELSPGEVREAKCVELFETAVVMV